MTDPFSTIIAANYTVGEINQLDLTAQFLEAKRRVEEQNFFSKHVDHLPAEDDPEDGA